MECGAGERVMNPTGHGTFFFSSWVAQVTTRAGASGVLAWVVGRGVGERRGQGGEWSEL